MSLGQNIATKDNLEGFFVMLTTALVEGLQFYAKRKFLRYSQLKIWSQKLKQFCKNTEYVTFLGLF